jgi:hypothetical protein
MSWNNDFWLILAGDKPSLRFSLHAKNHPFHLPVELVAGEPRVPVDKAVLALLDQVDEKSLSSRLQDESMTNWRNYSSDIRAAAGKTVGLFKAVTAIIVPRISATRSTLAFNVYDGLCFDLTELSQIVDEDVRARLNAVTKQRATTYEIAPLLGVMTPPALRAEARAQADGDGEGPAVEAPEEEEEAPAAATTWDQHHNLIFFGPPGTGKSFQLQQIVASHLRATDDAVYRVTFHPEFSYFDFVGTYKPRVGWMNSTNVFTDADAREHRNREPRVYYAFDPGPLSKALVQALRSPKQSVVLVIEEINRGNCAAIFGDVFQLLDRFGSDDVKDERRGLSEYPIVPNAEWSAWLDEKLAGATTPCWHGGRLALPANLFFYATMNTSDQSLFPMDTAFRRRWGLQYVGIDTPAGVRTRVRVTSSDHEGVAWVAFSKVLNDLIVEHTRSDDKQMGPWFVKRAQGEQFVADVQFRSKVLFYLWSEVFRDAPQKAFHESIRTYDQLVRRHVDGHRVFSDEVFTRLGSSSS